MDVAVPIGLMVMLAACLGLSVWLRVREWRKQSLLAGEREPEGQGIDVSAVTSRVQRLRQDYAAAARSRPNETCLRRGLLESARRAMVGRSYFRHARGARVSWTEQENSD